jgi:hypothetical protein
MAKILPLSASLSHDQAHLCAEARNIGGNVQCPCRANWAMCLTLPMAESIPLFTELLGLPCSTPETAIGRVRDAAVVPLVHPARIDRFPWAAVGLAERHYDQIDSISRRHPPRRETSRRIIPTSTCCESADLLDQRIIDVNGRKGPTTTSLEIRNAIGNGQVMGMGTAAAPVHSQWTPVSQHFRRLRRACCPRRRRLQRVIPPNSIRWEFCNIVEPDHSGVCLNISHESWKKSIRLTWLTSSRARSGRAGAISQYHSEVAAREALSEVDPRMQADSQSMEPKAADIVEEMQNAQTGGADILKGLEESTSEEILEEMEVARVGSAWAAGI